MAEEDVPMMTREQAEAAGYRLFTPERSEGCNGLVFMDANNNRHRLYSWGLSEQEAVDSILAAVTAIERYPEAVKLLEEATEVLRKQRDFDFERDDGGRIHNESMEVLAKLEDHHAGT